MKRIISLLLVLMLFQDFAASQILEPIKWKIDLNETNQEIVFSSTIEPGWHLYNMNLPEGGPISTTFNIEKLEGVKLKGTIEAKTKAIFKKDEVFGMELSWFEKQATFVQKINISDKDSSWHYDFSECCNR